MDFLEIMQKRRSCRAYQPNRTIPREDLLKIVEAGRLSPAAAIPSRGNLLWWILRKPKPNSAMP